MGRDDDGLRAYVFFREVPEAGKANADEMTARAVADELQRRPEFYIVIPNPGESFKKQLVDVRRFGTDLVYSMMRDPENLAGLEELEDEGVLVVNSPGAVRACLNRKTLFEELRDEGIGHVPPTAHVSLEELKSRIVGDYPVILKHPGKHGIRARLTPDEEIMGTDTVVKAYGTEDVDRFIELAAEAGREGVLIQEFIEGTPYKAYMVGGRLLYLKSETTPGLDPDTTETVIRYLREASRHAGVFVTGGDLIVTDGGGVYLTDLNDAPSMSPIRAHAARLIAEHCTTMLYQR